MVKLVKHIFNISLVGPSAIDKSSLVYTAAEYLAFKKKKGKLSFCGRNLEVESLFYQQEVFWCEMAGGDFAAFSSDRCWSSHSRCANEGEQFHWPSRCRWAGMAEQVKERHMIHVSSLGLTSRRFEAREVLMILFPNSHHIMSLSDPDLWYAPNRKSILCYGWGCCVPRLNGSSPPTKWQVALVAMQNTDANSHSADIITCE